MRILKIRSHIVCCIAIALNVEAGCTATIRPLETQPAAAQRIRVLVTATRAPMTQLPTPTPTPTDTPAPTAMPTPTATVAPTDTQVPAPPLPTAPPSPTTVQPSPAPDLSSSVSWPTQSWRISSPQEQGMNTGLLNDMLAYIDAQAINLHSILVIRHGAIVAERYYGGFNESTRSEVYSCTKSFTSTLVGIALDKGFLSSIDQPVLGVFPERSFENTDQRKQAMTIKNLLTMTPGLAWEESDTTYAQMYSSPDWLQYILNKPMEFNPGSQFEYDSGASHVLSTIIQKSSGMNTADFARANLFEPLGIKGAQWHTDASDVPIGGWGLQLTPREMAKLGYLFLHRGEWEGRRIVSSDWVNAATKMQVLADNTLGYGYQWWISADGSAYMALGRYGQAIYVKPDLDLVVVITAQETDHDRALGLIGAFILPACWNGP